MPTAVDGSTTIVPSSWARTADLEWRDRAIRAEALLDRLQVENQELRERSDALEAVKTKLEDENRTLYGAAGRMVPSAAADGISVWILPFAPEYPSGDSPWTCRIYPQREIPLCGTL